VAVERRIVTGAIILFLIFQVFAASTFSLSSLAVFAATSKVNGTSGLLTGRIFDKGIDKDGNGLFDYLQVNVEVNITTAGTYYVSIGNLENATEWPQTYAYVYDAKTIYLGAMVQNVTMSLYGPTIQTSGQNDLKFVGYISIYSQIPDYYQSDYEQGVALSRPYSYSEFDSPFTDMTAVFRVLPDGTVNMSAVLNATRMPYPTNGMNINASLDVSTSGDSSTVSTSEGYTLPSDIASQWPLNASTVSMVADYSKQIGDLNIGLNSTVVLEPGYPPRGMSPYELLYGSQYPWNSSDFTLNIASSNGIATGELEALTILPTGATSMFPFNATDFSLKANYLAGLLRGNVTFHILSGFPLGDLILDFEASRTQATFSGNVTVIYGTYGTTIVDEAYVDAIIGNVTVLEGTGPGSLFNMTNGLAELDPASSITKTPLASSGVTVDFNMTVDGDLTALVAYVISEGNVQGITYPGVFRLLNATVTSFDSASIQMSYYRGMQTASLDLKFSSDLNKLVATLVSFPDDTFPLIIDSSDMRTTLEIGDIVLVKNITDASEINAAPHPDGDIITFTPNSGNPDEIVVHRAISETLLNGTWYFQTQADNGYGPDFWTGPDTYDGMISEELVLGKVVERIPSFSYLYSGIGNPFGLAPNLRGVDVPQLAKDLASLTKKLDMQLVYASSSSTFDLKLTSTFDAKGYEEKILPKLPDLAPSSMKTFATELLTHIYANATTGHGTLTYKDCSVESQATITTEGDLAREINHVKNLYINELLNSTSPEYREPWLIINASWLDASNLTAKFSMFDDSAYFSFDGFQASPPIDQIDTNTFRLSRFFNLTKSMAPYSTEMPRNYEKLMLKLQCIGSGAEILTMTVPPTMTHPDSASADQTHMVWNNQSISSLRDIVFSVQGYIEVPGKDPVIICSNGQVSVAVLDPPNKRINVTIDGPHGQAGYANVTIPKSVLDGPIDSWIIITGNTTILYPDYQIISTATHTFLYFTFNFSSPITIQIIGLIPDFPSQILPLFIIVTAIAAIVSGATLKIRRKHRALGTLT
jgi:signal peptidase I